MDRRSRAVTDARLTRKRPIVPRSARSCRDEYAAGIIGGMRLGLEVGAAVVLIAERSTRDGAAR